MGFNPHRKYKARTTDYVVVAAASIAALGLVVWAFFA